MAQAAEVRPLVLTHFFPLAGPDATKHLAATESTGPNRVAGNGRRIAPG